MHKNLSTMFLWMHSSLSSVAAAQTAHCLLKNPPPPLSEATSSSRVSLHGVLRRELGELWADIMIQDHDRDTDMIRDQDRDTECSWP